MALVSGRATKPLAYPPASTCHTSLLVRLLINLLLLNGFLGTSPCHFRPVGLNVCHGYALSFVPLEPSKMHN